MSDETVTTRQPHPVDAVAARRLEIVARNVVAQEHARNNCEASEILHVKAAETVAHRALIREVETLTQALESRTQIGMAIGMLMARENISDETAFDMLRRASQRTNRKIREIAVEMLQAHRQRLDSPA